MIPEGATIKLTQRGREFLAIAQEQGLEAANEWLQQQEIEEERFMNQMGWNT